MLILSNKDRNVLRIFERGILRMVYVSIKGDGIWRTRYNNEPEVVKIGRLKWLGQLFRMQELNP